MRRKYDAARLTVRLRDKKQMEKVKRCAKAAGVSVNTYVVWTLDAMAEKSIRSTLIIADPATGSTASVNAN